MNFVLYEILFLSSIIPKIKKNNNIKKNEIYSNLFPVSKQNNFILNKYPASKIKKKLIKKKTPPMLATFFLCIFRLDGKSNIFMYDAILLKLKKKYKFSKNKNIINGIITNFFYC